MSCQNTTFCKFDQPPQSSQLHLCRIEMMRNEDKVGLVLTGTSATPYLCEDILIIIRNFVFFCEKNRQTAFESFH